MNTLDRFFRNVVMTCIACVPFVVAAVAYDAVSNLRLARERSRQQRTMVLMRDAGSSIEKGAPVGRMKDAWGFPMQVRVNDVHYSIRSAGFDGEFEKTTPRGPVDGFDADLVLAEGAFLQYPEGI